MSKSQDAAYKALLAETDSLFHGSIVKGVLLDATLALKQGRHRAAVILTYSGIDAIASLMRPAAKDRVNRKDFIGSVDKYLIFGVDGAPTGVELYSARCGILHAYSVESDFTKQGKARQIGYVNFADKAVLNDPEAPNLVLLSIRDLIRGFAKGLQQSWKDIEASPDLVRLVHQRLQLLFQEFRQH